MPPPGGNGPHVVATVCVHRDADHVGMIRSIVDLKLVVETTARISSREDDDTYRTPGNESSHYLGFHLCHGLWGCTSPDSGQWCPQGVSSTLPLSEDDSLAWYVA